MEDNFFLTLLNKQGMKRYTRGDMSTPDKSVPAATRLLLERVTVLSTVTLSGS